MRFYIDKQVDGEWVEVEDTSHCTHITEDDNSAIRLAALGRIMDTVKPLIRKGESVKRACEKLSWLKAEDFLR
jgi:hypothetical protein